MFPLLALGSWRTYERISREEGVAVMRAAREHGIRFLDDARYDDEIGGAPMATGYSEVVFGELFRAVGWERDELVVANKLWWEFWPEQSAGQELDGSLERMGFDYVDLIYSWAAAGGPPIEEIVRSVGALIASGKARAWGTGNWEPREHAEAARIARAEGVPPPCVAQLPYNLTLREHVEAPAAAEALSATGAAVVASYALAGGALTGKYASSSMPGRMARELADPELEPALRAGKALRTLAAKLETTPAALAIAFALTADRVAAVLFGATSAAQVVENVRAVDLLDHLEPEDLAALQRIGV